MRKTFLLALTCALALVITAAAQQGALQTAATTLGAATIKSIEFTGTGQMYSVGQNYVASDPWPAVPPQSPYPRLPRPGPGLVVTSSRRWGALTAG